MSDPTDPRAPDPALRRTEWGVAIFALAAIAAHDGVHVSEGRWWDTFWVCNLAALLVGPSILLRSPLLAAACLTWLVPGTVVWLVDGLCSGQNILPTSYLIHFGGTAAAIYSTRVNGWSPRGWLAALGLFAFAVLVARYALPPGTNVNAARDVPRGWSTPAGGYAVFVAIELGIALAACGLGSLLGRLIAGGAGTRAGAAGGVSG
ncbi:MAG: hypothetical protein FJ104_01410 [Deltaproteobacteria bacterium]|nr:hypothetical protein [Deltaproteobacteria bacterium]